MWRNRYANVFAPLEKALAIYVAGMDLSKD